MSFESDRKRSFQGPDLLEYAAGCLAGRLGDHVLYEQVQVILEVGNYLDREVPQKISACHVHLTRSNTGNVDLIFDLPYREARIKVSVDRFELCPHRLMSLGLREPALDGEGCHQ